MPPKKRSASALAQAEFAAVQKAYEDAKAKFDSHYEEEQQKYEYAMNTWGLIERDCFSASSAHCLAMVTCADAIVYYRETVVIMDAAIVELRSRAMAPGASVAVIKDAVAHAQLCLTGLLHDHTTTNADLVSNVHIATKLQQLIRACSGREIPIPIGDHISHTAPESLPKGYIKLFLEYFKSQQKEEKEGGDPTMEQAWRVQLLAKAASILPDCHVAWRLLFFYLEDGSETVKIGGLEYNAAQCLAKVVELLPRDFGSWWRLGVHLRTGPDPLTTVVRVSGESLRYTDCFMRAAKLQPSFVPCQECLKPEMPLPGGSLPPFRFPKLPKETGPEGADGRMNKVATNANQTKMVMNGAAALVPQPEVAPVESISQAHHPATSLPGTGSVPTSGEDSDLSPISTQSSSTSSVATEDLPTASDIDIDEFELIEEPPKSGEEPPQSLPPPSAPNLVPPVAEGQRCKSPHMPSRSTSSVATEDLPTASDIDIDEFELIEEPPKSGDPEPPQPAPLQPSRPRILVVLAVGIGCTAVLATVAAKYRRR